MTGVFVRHPTAVDVYARRFGARLTRAAAGRRWVVWGAGRAGALAVRQLRAAGIEVALVVDRDPARPRTEALGVRVGGLDELDTRERDFVVLASMYAPEMASWLETRGWRDGWDFEAFPAGAIYRPEAGFVVAGLPDAPARRDRRDAGRSETSPAVTLLASSDGNFYFRELRDFLADGLARAGWPVNRADERAAVVAGVPIVVGPHEFFTIGDGLEWLSAENLQAAVLVTTEQPQSMWTQTFERALRLAGAVVDINGPTCEHLRARGVPAHWLPLGWYDGCDPFDRVPAGLTCPDGWDVAVTDGPLAAVDADPWDRRPLDVLFIGASSPRRERLLAGLRDALPHLRWAVHMPSDLTSTGGVPQAQIDTAAAVALARRAKVLLNLHRDDSTYFEWQRLVWRGLWQRTLVVTEPVEAPRGLAAGAHYLEARTIEVAAALRAVFADTGHRRADAVRCAGHDAARRIAFGDAVDVLASAVRAVGSEGVAA